MPLKPKNDNKNVIQPLYLLDLKPIDFKINRFKKPWFEIHWFLNSLFGSFYKTQDLKFIIWNSIVWIPKFGFGFGFEINKMFFPIIIFLKPYTF